MQHEQDPQMTSHGDRSLLRRFRGGEQDAATALYLKYAQRIRKLTDSQTPPSLSPRFDAEDVVQSVFRTFFRRASAGLYDVPPGEELWQLLLVISLNKIRTMASHHRAQKRDAGRTQGSTALEHAEQYSPTKTSQDETSLCVLELVIEDLMGELTRSQQDIIRLRIEGHTVVDISDKTRRSKRTVERVLQDFRRELSEQIHGDAQPSV